MIRSWCIFHQKLITARQSISFTKPTNEWLKVQVNKKAYSIKNELVNDLISQVRKQKSY